MNQSLPKIVYIGEEDQDVSQDSITNSNDSCSIINTNTTQYHEINTTENHELSNENYRNIVSYKVTNI